MLFTVTSTSGFYSPQIVFLELRLRCKWGLGFIDIISLFTFQSRMVLSLITLYLFTSTPFLPRNNNEKYIERRKT
jgi:hypothetical protein